MKKIIILIGLLLVAGHASAEHLLVKGGYFIRDVNVLSRSGDVVEYQKIDSHEVRKIHVEYIERVSELLPKDRKELTPENLNKFMGNIEDEVKASRVMHVGSLDTACDLYKVNKKDPYLAMALSTFLPSLGHAYAGDWGRGQKFIIFDLLLIGSFFIPIEDYDIAAYRPVVTTMLSLVLKSIEMYDAVLTAEDYNQQLRKDLKIQLGVDERGIRLDLKF